MVAEHVMASQSAEELFARAKALNKEGKYKKACELIEEAYAIQPKISTALSAANLRLKLGDHEKAIAAYRGVLSLVGTENGPTGVMIRNLPLRCDTTALRRRHVQLSRHAASGGCHHRA